MNTDRIRELADIIEARVCPSHEAPGFSMASYFTAYSELEAPDFCGTTACIAGHAIICFGTEAERCNLYTIQQNTHETAAQLLDLPHTLSMCLFYDYRLDRQTAAKLLRVIADHAADFYQTDAETVYAQYAAEVLAA